MQGRSIALRIENIEVFTHGDVSTHFYRKLDYGAPRRYYNARAHLGRCCPNKVARLL